MTNNTSSLFWLDSSENVVICFSIDGELSGVFPSVEPSVRRDSVQSLGLLEKIKRLEKILYS